MTGLFRLDKAKVSQHSFIKQCCCKTDEAVIPCCELRGQVAGLDLNQELGSVLNTGHNHMQLLHWYPPCTYTCTDNTISNSYLINNQKHQLLSRRLEEANFGFRFPQFCRLPFWDHLPLHTVTGNFTLINIRISLLITLGFPITATTNKGTPAIKNLSRCAFGLNFLRHLKTGAHQEFFRCTQPVKGSIKYS